MDQVGVRRRDIAIVSQRRFIPTAFYYCITWQVLNRQFALTIAAINVDLAFNSLTLSSAGPGRVALKPRTPKKDF